MFDLRSDRVGRRLHWLQAEDPDGRHDAPWRTIVAAVVGVVAVVVGLFLGPISGPSGLLVLAIGGAAAALVLASPTVALVVLMSASFLRLMLQVPGLPAEPMILVMCLLVVTAVHTGLTGRARFHVGPIEVAMVAYLLWNVLSMVLPHELPAIEPGTGQPISVYRFIVMGTVLPFVGFVVARAVLHGEERVRRVMYFLVAVAAYSAVVSILQFTGPASLVFPQYIVSAPSYPERAVGVVNQPLVNGMIMVAGFVTAMLLAQHRSLSRSPKVLMLMAAVLCLPGIYLTKTRAVWLVFGLALIVCAVLSRTARRGFVATLLVIMLGIVSNWSTFTSSDREAGGIASTNEVDDRLNSMATAFWAIDQKPLMGWGISRFAQVNAVYHQAWAADVKFERGYAIASHENELGIATELGLIGLALWLAVIIPLAVGLVRALIRLPPGPLGGRALGLVAAAVLGMWVVSGFTADLRFFDFANLVAFVLVGAAIGTADRMPRQVTRPRRRARTPITAGTS